MAVADALVLTGSRGDAETILPRLLEFVAKFEPFGDRSGP
jgi:hypothetical protein